MSSKRTTRRGAERRKDPRADARLSMRVEGAPDGDTAHIVTESQNISASGIYCYSSHYLAPLSKVDLTIVLPNLPGGQGVQELIKCEGIVVRCEGTTHREQEEQFELACMFSELDDERRVRIEEFVTWRNLQALRAAASAPDRRSTRTRKAAATRKSAGSKRKATASRSPARRTGSTTARKGTRAASAAKGTRAGSSRKTPSRRTAH